MPECEGMPSTLTPEIIDAVIDGFEAQKRRIDEQIAALRSIRAGASPAGDTSAPDIVTARPRRKMSAAGRKAIAEAQRKRWAAKKSVASLQPTKAAKPKRKLSAAGRANIVAALKKRWAAKKARAKK